MEIGGGTIVGRPVQRMIWKLWPVLKKCCTAQELNKMANKDGNQLYRGNGC